MKIFLAGGITGNLRPLWSEVMKLYLSGAYSRDYCIKESMKIFLAGNFKHTKLYFKNDLIKSPYILESFFYIKKIDWIIKMIPFFKDFLLDSGAFTYMQGGDIENIDWNKYIENYAEFIIKNNITYFFELDIDCLVGIQKVEYLREKLEDKVGRQCIPVWHKSRGRDYWHKMIEIYKYVAIGGIVSKEIIKKDYPIFNYFLSEANKKNCKVHGLGFSGINEVIKYKFYSVDSTSWLYGNRGGYLYKFENGLMSQIDCPTGKRLKSRAVALHNFLEWVKFQQYAEKYL